LRISTYKNRDNITMAVHGLDIFTKNWCMNCKETEKQNDLVFRCKECEFQAEDGKCFVKMFANNHKHDYPMSNFGSMGSH
jgi:capsid protein